MPANHAKLKTEQLIEQLKRDVPAYRVELLRALKDRGDKKAADTVKSLAGDAGQAAAVRAQAVVTLAALDAIDVDQMIRLATGPRRGPAAGGPAGPRRGQTEPRASGRWSSRSTPTRSWSPGSWASRSSPTGRRSPTRPRGSSASTARPTRRPAGASSSTHKLANCSKCHRVEGRGSDVGPDLSLIGRTERKWIVESLLQPSAVVAPHYQPWKVDTIDGKSRVGQLVHTHLDESTYLDAKGDRFKVLAGDVVEASPTKGSIMPSSRTPHRRLREGGDRRWPVLVR